MIYLRQQDDHVLDSALCLNANIFTIAVSLVASQPSPQTISVG